MKKTPIKLISLIKMTLTKTQNKKNKQQNEVYQTVSEETPESNRICKVTRIKRRIRNQRREKIT